MVCLNNDCEDIQAASTSYRQDSARVFDCCDLHCRKSPDARDDCRWYRGKRTLVQRIDKINWNMHPCRFMRLTEFSRIANPMHGYWKYLHSTRRFCGRGTSYFLAKYFGPCGHCRYSGHCPNSEDLQLIACFVPWSVVNAISIWIHTAVCTCRDCKHHSENVQSVIESSPQCLSKEKRIQRIHPKCHANKHVPASNDELLLAHTIIAWQELLLLDYIKLNAGHVKHSSVSDCDAHGNLRW